MKTSAFDYELPSELIAQRPCERRDDARLLVLKRKNGAIERRRFRDLPRFLRSGDLLALNDAKVSPCRLYARKSTGAKIEITLLEVVDGEKQVYRALLKPSKRVKTGMVLKVGDAIEALPVARDEDGKWSVRIAAQGHIAEVLERVGRAPLPPYIKRTGDEAREMDIERYQTVYARGGGKIHDLGAVAAPTAGLHFTPQLLDDIESAGAGVVKITLHVGWGSFAPLREEHIEDHVVEPEEFRVSAECAEAVNSTRQKGGKVVAVGTTTVRALETAWKNGRLEPTTGVTDLFITPGYRFNAVDALLTNFHLPRSSLLTLAAAFAGLDAILEAYREAIRLRYRFYSYGDAMLIL